MPSMKENINELEVLSLEFQKEVVTLEQCLKNLKENIELLQNGDTNGLCWNGENALNANKALAGHYDHDVVLLENVKKCSDYIASVVKKK